MKKTLILSVFLCLFSSPVFSQTPNDDGLSPSEEAFLEQFLEALFDEILAELADAAAITQQNDNLVYSNLDTIETEVTTTGMMGTTLGSYTDLENGVILDNNTPSSQN